MALQQTSRPLAHFSPSIWGDHFASFPSNKLILMEEYAKEVELLKEEVRAIMLLDDDIKPAEKIGLINSLERIGVSYHFEKEIEAQLDHIFHLHSASVDDNEYDLYTISLQFRVFRQHGYKMSCDVFNKFKESNGEIKKTIASDPRGMLSLYEATHLRLRGEDFLDEALVFTTAQLESMKTHLSPPLAKQVNQALNRPFHMGMPRIEARHYISVYEEDESRSELLLKLAKFDFNQVQLLHQQELSHIARWWKDLDFSSKLCYSRDRLVECFFWAMGVYFEPRYSAARIILTKILAVFTVIDDTYDSYGTLEELHLFTQAMDRFDVSAIYQLPDYMKVLYRSILDLFDKFDEEMTKGGGSYGVYDAKEELKETCRSYFVEAKWYNSGYLPPFEEYLGNALISSGYHAVTTACFAAMGEIAPKEAFQWLRSRPKMVIASEALARLMDDIVSHEFEQKRGHVASGVECYMKEYGVSKKEVIDEFQKRISNAWKDMSEECMRPTAVSMELLMRIVNLSRVIDVIYRYQDGFTNSEGLKDFISSLFLNSIPL